MLTFYIVFFILGLVFGEAACTFVVCGGVESALPLISCSACGRKLRPSECIPILSYRVINGNCLTCGRKIPKIYPAFELISGAAWFICALVFGLSALLPAALAVVSVALIAAAADINTGKISNMPSIFLVIIGVIRSISAYADAPAQLIESLIGFFAAGLIIFAAGKIKKGFTDGGDIKLMAAAGLALGARSVLAAILLAAAAYLSFRLPGIIKNERSDANIPLGPFFALGILLSLFVLTPLFFN